MNIIQRITKYQFSFMLVLLIATYGCQTASNITSEPDVKNLQSESLQADKESTGGRAPQTSPVKNETTTTEEPSDQVTGKPGEIDKKSLTELQKEMVSRWLGAGGHGWAPISKPAEEEANTAEKPADKVTEKSNEIERGPFVDLEKNVVGEWLNLKETESIEFLDDGTIIITDREGDRPKLKGNYKFVDKGRLRVDFKGDFYAKLMPPMHFKIFVSENEITLTDEPDGAATVYKRIK
jgi:hypothetical protein